MEAQNKIEEVACRNCHLTTPKWRESCIHCGKPKDGMAFTAHRPGFGLIGRATPSKLIH